MIEFEEAHGFEPTENPLDVDEDELIELELLELEQPDEPPIKVSDNEVSIPPKK